MCSRGSEQSQSHVTNYKGWFCLSNPLIINGSIERWWWLLTEHYRNKKCILNNRFLWDPKDKILCWTVQEVGWKFYQLNKVRKLHKYVLHKICLERNTARIYNGVMMNECVLKCVHSWSLRILLCYLLRNQRHKVLIGQGS